MIQSLLVGKLSQVVMAITMDKNTKCVMMALGSDIAAEAQRMGALLRRLFRKETLELDVEGSVAVPQWRKRRGRCSW